MVILQLDSFNEHISGSSLSSKSFRREYLVSILELDLFKYRSLISLFLIFDGIVQEYCWWVGG